MVPGLRPSTMVHGACGAGPAALHHTWCMVRTSTMCDPGLDQDIDVWGCSVASSARRGVRQQIRAQLSARGSRLFLFVALQSSQDRSRPPFALLFGPRQAARGRQLRWQRTALWQQRRRSLACSPFFTALRRSRTPKCMRQDHRIANSFR